MEMALHTTWWIPAALTKQLSRQQFKLIFSYLVSFLFELKELQAWPLGRKFYYLQVNYTRR